MSIRKILTAGVLGKTGAFFEGYVEGEVKKGFETDKREMVWSIIDDCPNPRSAYVHAYHRGKNRHITLEHTDMGWAVTEDTTDDGDDDK